MIVDEKWLHLLWLFAHEDDERLGALAIGCNPIPLCVWRSGKRGAERVRERERGVCVCGGGSLLPREAHAWSESESPTWHRKARARKIPPSLIRTDG